MKGPPLERYELARDPGSIPEPSVYLLVSYLPKDTILILRTLGELRLRKGTYIYTGSAKAGLRARVPRHLRKITTPRWHIDYLSQVTTSKTVWRKPYGPDEECGAARELSRRYEGIKGFGCSDCKCGSHLFYIGEGEDFLCKGKYKGENAEENKDPPEQQ
ncbi:MAG: GIY-YIG nuclease family protein [Thermoplasmatota archaeon]